MVFLEVTQVWLIVATVKETRLRSSFSELFVERLVKKNTPNTPPTIKKNEVTTSCVFPN